MPRELNVEKLERKFASLTKSRESIQAVSSWIMHHHEFCQEIVDQWYIALTKDHNALVMFYVANEIIQSCGKKKVPQYREAFSKVLEKAVCLEKVKEIKSDVIRILSLWKERSIFDYGFFQRLETNLNGPEVTASPTVEKEEVSELEVITNYKSGNLFDSLKKLKTVETEAKEKEEILNYADEPQLSEMSNLTVQDECLEMLEKIDSFYSLVEECLKATTNVVKARENAMKELKYSCIFYTAQHGDVKKVANAYTMYGKRLKNMERKLSEKLLVLPSPIENNSLCFSESNTRASPIGVSPFDHDASNISRASSKASPRSLNEKSCDASSDNLKNNTSFWNKISKRASSDFPKNLEQKLEDSEEKRLEQSPKKFSKLAELFAETKSDSEKQGKPESSTLDSLPGVSNVESPDKLKENTSDLLTTTDMEIDATKNATKLSSNQKLKAVIDHSKEETSNETENAVTAEDVNEIDNLLEESYDTKKAKTNLSAKRKIELLLQSKGKKVCTDASKETKSNTILISDSSAENSLTEGIKTAEDSIKEDNSDLNCLGGTSINEKENKMQTDLKVTVPTVSPNSNIVEKTTFDTISSKERGTPDTKKNLSLEEKIQNVSKMFSPSSNSIELCKEIDFLTEQSNSRDSLSFNNETLADDSSKNNSIVISEPNFDSESTKIFENDDFSIETPSTFFNSSLFSSVSSISTECLKNILGNNKNDPSMDTENNSLTDAFPVKDSSESGKPIENKDSENIAEIPASSSVESAQLSKENLPLSNMVMQPTCEAEGSENIGKKDVDIKEDTKPKEIASPVNISIKSNDSEQLDIDPQVIPDFTVTKLEETVISSNVQKIPSPFLEGQLKPIDQKAEDKPNLLLTLQNILECISNKNLSVDHSTDPWKATPVSFQNCLNLYHTLKSADTKLKNGTILSNTQNAITSKTTPESTITSSNYNQDNLEVMDMECDSD